MIQYLQLSLFDVMPDAEVDSLWLREQAQIIDLQSHELSNTYSARYWRTK